MHKFSKSSNYFDYISFPDKEQRDWTRNNFFDTKYLRINQNILNSKNMAITNLNNQYLVRCLKRKIINFNNTVVYLDLAILQMVNYYKLFKTANCKDEELIYATLFKQTSRNVACEIFVYEEKIKNILNYITTCLNGKNEIDDKDLFKEFKKACKNRLYCLEFSKLLNNYRIDKAVEEIRDFRNAEVHNESDLFIDYDNYNSSFNDNLLNKIKLCLDKMIALNSGLNKFLSSFINELY